MTHTIIKLGAQGLLLSILGCATRQGVTSPTVQKIAPTAVVARYSGGEITSGDLEGTAAGTLLPIRQQLFDLQTRILEDMVFERQVAVEARKASITSDAFMRGIVDNNLPQPSEEDIAKAKRQLRNELPRDAAQAREMIVARFQDKEKQSRVEALRRRMLLEAGFQLFLEPPRVDMRITPEDPSRGPLDAPVVLVEYSDFQCPYCKNMQKTLSVLEEKYPGKIRFIYKHYPVDVHPNARPAASASMCAAEQGGFWPYHDRLFASTGELSKELMLSLAKDLNLDGEQFTACFDSARFGPKVEQDIIDAEKSGVTGAPAYLINGRLIPGALPLETFTTIIDDELRRAERVKSVDSATIKK